MANRERGDKHKIKGHDKDGFGRWYILKGIAFLLLAWNIVFRTPLPTDKNRADWQKGIYAHEERDGECIDDGFTYWRGYTPVDTKIRAKGVSPWQAESSFADRNLPL